METENKDWKPEVGKTAWFAGFDSVYEILITDVLWEESQNPWYKGTIWFHPLTSEYNAEIGTWDIFPTSEAALASIKIYDLEGKEVVIPRADGIPVHFVGVCGDCSKQMVLSDEEDNAFQRVVRMAYSLPIEGGGAANGGKSDAREGGC